MVCFTHYSSGFFTFERCNQNFLYKILSGLINAEASVILFFVLSGYVLTLSLERNTGYVQYLIKRMFRIYPVYWVVIIFISVVIYFSNPSLMSRCFP